MEAAKEDVHSIVDVAIDEILKHEGVTPKAFGQIREAIDLGDEKMEAAKKDVHLFVDCSIDEIMKHKFGPFADSKGH